MVEIQWHLISISSRVFFPGQTWLPNPGELGIMVQTRVTEKMKTYGKGCPRKSKAQKKRGPVIFLDIHKVPDCYTLQAALVNYHHPLFVSNELLRSLLHPYFWSYVLNVCADLCLKSSLVNSKLRLMKSRWMVLPRGFQLYSSSVGH